MATVLATLLLVSVALSLCLRPTLQAQCHQAVSQYEYPNCRQMDGKYSLHWSLSNDSVTFAIQVDQTSGWFALGLSEGGGMRGADVWLFTQSSGTWSVRDYWSVDYVTPKEDSLQDGELLSVQQSNGSTVAVFRRKLDTCDLEHDQKMFPGHKQPYIWAYGAEGFGYHGTRDRGTLFISLNSTKGSGSIVSNDDPDFRRLAFTMDDYIVPAEVTSYTCINFEAPTNDTYHLTSTNYTITPNKMVHHMLFMACDRTPQQPLLQPFDCPGVPAECSNLWLVWVPGQEPEEMPPNTGFRFGRNSTRYVMVQIHYTNPDLTPNVKDSSGFVISYTPNLRQYDLGVMWLGTENFEIPPGEEMAGIPPSICPSECTSRFSSPLNLVASEFHMHQLGARQTAQHLVALMDGRWEETEPLNYRNHYDFDWQGGTFILPGSETFTPGSALITTCWWNTKSQKNTTYFGLSSFDEMCYNFLRYWPAQKIDRCLQVLGTENNGTALAQCNNQGEFMTYIEQKNYTDFNQSVIMDLVQKGFLVQFNTTPYKDFKPYNRTTPTCAATLAARQSGASPVPPAAQPGAGPAAAAGDRSAAAGRAATGVPALLAMATIVVAYVL